MCRLRGSRLDRYVYVGPRSRRAGLLIRSGDILLYSIYFGNLFFFFFKDKAGIGVVAVTGVQTCALPISRMHVVDFVASDVADVLHKADGKRVEVAGRPTTLTIAGARVETVEPNLIETFLHVVVNPQIDRKSVV